MEYPQTWEEEQRYKIAKRNDLVQLTAFGLNKAEYDLLNYMIMKLKPEDEEFYPMEISIKEYCNFMGIDGNNNYAYIRKTAKGLSDKSVWAYFEDENGESSQQVVRWIEEPKIRRGKVVLTFKPYWKPFLLGLENNYTSLLFQETADMKSVYSKRTYEILKSYVMDNKGPITIRIEIEEYKRLILGEEEYKKIYKDANNFKVCVLEKVMKDLSNHGKLKVSYNLIKEGYSYKYVDFTVSLKNTDTKEKESKNTTSLTCPLCDQLLVYGQLKKGGNFVWSHRNGHLKGSKCSKIWQHEEDIEKAWEERRKRENSKNTNDGTADVTIKQLKDYYEYIKAEDEKKYKTRNEEIAAAIPEIEAITNRIKELTRDVINIAPGKASKEKREENRKERHSLEKKKRSLLVKRGYPEDYLERKYRCSACKDSGYTDEGRTCSCAKQRAEEAYEWINKKRS